MANIKITDLSLIADPISTDVLPIVDVSADTTNKISIEQLLRNAAAGTAALPAFAFDDDPDTGIYRTGADGLGFSTGGTGRLFIDSSGNIGVGAASSGSKLEVYANNSAASGLLTLNQDGTGDATLDFVLTGTREYSLGIDNSDSDKFKLAGTAGVGTSDLLTITSSGNVGVGATNPQARLHVAESGGATISLQDSSANNGVNYASIQADGTTALVLKASGGTTSKAIKFLSSTTAERMTITSSGNVGIGTSTPQSELVVRGSTPQIVLEPTSDSQDCRVQFATTNGTIQSTLKSGGGLGSQLAFFQGSSERFRIDSSGNIGIGTSSPSAKLDISRLGADWTGAAPVSGTGLRVHNGNNAASSPAYIQLSAGSSAKAGIYFGDDAASNVGSILYDNSTNALQLGTNQVERVRIDPSGRLQVGASANVGNILPNYGSTVYYPGTQITGTSYQDNNWVGISTFSNSTTASGGSFITLSKSNNPTINSHTAVNTGQLLGAISFAGSDGTAFKNAAHISCTSGSTVGTNQMSGKLIFSTNNGGLNSDEAMRIDENGNVGIGTASPSSILHIKGGGPLIIENGPSSSFGVEEFLRVDNGGVVVDRALQGFELANGGSRSHAISHNLNITSDGSAYTYTQGNYSGSNLIEFENGQIKIYADEQVTSGSQDAITPTEVFRIDNNGKVGIGTPSPGRQLHIAGTNNILRLESTSTVASRIEFENTGSSSSDSVSIGSVNNDMQLVTSGSERMRIDSSGNLLLGGTASPTSATKSLAIFNGTAPTASVTDGIVLYAEDVSSSSELKVRDEAGNVTTLSPHNFDLIPEGPSEDMAWSYYSEKDGKRINVDMLKAVRLLEQLTGEKLVFTA